MSEEFDKRIEKLVINERNAYERECDRRIAEEEGRIAGADFMLQRFLEVYNTEKKFEKKEETRSSDCRIDEDKLKEMYKHFKDYYELLMDTKSWISTVTVTSEQVKFSLECLMVLVELAGIKSIPMSELEDLRNRIGTVPYD